MNKVEKGAPTTLEPVAFPPIERDESLGDALGEAGATGGEEDDVGSVFFCRLQRFELFQSSVNGFDFHEHACTAAERSVVDLVMLVFGPGS